MNKSLAELRTENKMSQRDLAKKLGVSPVTIGMNPGKGHHHSKSHFDSKII